MYTYFTVLLLYSTIHEIKFLIWYKKLKSLHFHILLWILWLSLLKKRNTISETEFADVLQEWWSFEFAIPFPWLTFFFNIIIISSRTFETIDNASQGWDYAQLPEK